MPGTATSRTRKSQNIAPGQKAEYDIPSGPPGPSSPPWSAAEIVIIYWTVDTTDGCCKIDPSRSGRYSSNYFSGKPYSNIAAFATAVSNGSIVDSPTWQLYPNLGPNAQPWNFVIAQSCYIVYVLEQAMTQWQFLRGAVGVTTGGDPAGWYGDLYHVVGNSTASSVTGADCAVAYFSAYVDLTQDPGLDPFVLHVEYLQAGQWIILPYDPAIKNKGHNHNGVRPYAEYLKNLKADLIPEKKGP